MSTAASRRFGLALIVLGALLIVARAMTWFDWALPWASRGWFVPLGVALMGVGVLLCVRRPVPRFAVGVLLLAVAGLGAAVLWLFGPFGTTTLIEAGGRTATVTTVSGLGPETFYEIDVRRSVGPLVRIQRVGCVSDDALGFRGVAWQGSTLVVQGTGTTGEGDQDRDARVGVDRDGRVTGVDDPQAILRSCDAD